MSAFIEENEQDRPDIRKLKRIEEGVKEGRIDEQSFLSSDTPEAEAYMTFKKKALGKKIKNAVNEGRINQSSLVKDRPDAAESLALAEADERNPGSFERIVNKKNTLNKLVSNMQAEDETDFRELDDNDIANIEQIQNQLGTFNKFLDEERKKGVKISGFGDLLNMGLNYATKEQTRKSEVLKRAKFKSKTGKVLDDEEIEALAFDRSGQAELVGFLDPTDPYSILESALVLGRLGLPRTVTGNVALESGLGAAYPFIERINQKLNGENPDPITLEEIAFSTLVGAGTGLLTGGIVRATRPPVKGKASVFTGELPDNFKSPSFGKEFAAPDVTTQISSPAVPIVSRETHIPIPDDAPSTPGNTGVIKSLNPSANVDDIIRSESTAVDFNPDTPLEYFSAFSEANNATAKKTVQKGFIPIQRGAIFKKLASEELGAVGEGPTKSIRKDTPVGEGAGGYLDILDSSRKTKEEARRVSLQRLRKRFKTDFVDVAGNVKKELRLHGKHGEDAARRLELALGANERAIKRIDDMYGAVYEGLNANEKLTLDEYIITKVRRDSSLRREALRQDRLTRADLLPEDLRADALRAIDEDPLLQPLKNPGGASIDDLNEVLESAYPDDIRPMLEQRSEAFFSTMRKQLDELLDEGIISQDLHEKLYNNNYARIEFFEHIDPDLPSSSLGTTQKVNVTSSGIKKLKAGAEGELDLDTDELAAQVITRNQKIIMKNRANKSLYELAVTESQEGVENPIVHLPSRNVNVESLAEDAPILRTYDDGTADIAIATAKPKPGHKIISTYLDGQKHDMYMPDELAKEWIERDPAMSQAWQQWSQWLTGTKLLKLGATGVNPEFAVTNFPRDQSLAFITTNEHSSFLPLYMAQMGRDLFDTFSDAVTGKGLYARYVDEGGGMDFLAQQAFNRAPRSRNSTIEAVKNIASFLGTFSERWTRLSLMNRALKNGRTAAEAAHVARSYLDFSQGGHVAKAADNFIPYLNANIQATRSAARAAKTNPKMFAWKMGQLMAAGFGLSAAAYTKYKDVMDKIDENVRVRHWVIPLPWSYTDSDGNKRHRYMTIPKDQTAIFFTGVADAFARRIFNDEIPSDSALEFLKRTWDDLDESIKQSFSLFDASTLVPPTGQSAGAYIFNKDFWRNEDVWYNSNGFNNVFPWAEQYKSTQPFFKQIGEASKDIFGEENSISPVRLERATQKLFPTNIWTSGFDMGYRGISDALSDEEREFTDNIIDDQVRRIPFVRRVLRSTPALTQNEKEQVEIAKKKANTDRILQNRGLTDLLYGVENGEIGFEKVKKYINSFDDMNTKKRLLNRVETFQKLKDIPERAWWLNQASIQNPESRASSIWNVYKKENPENQQRMLRIMFTIPGFASKRFKMEFLRLKKEGGK